MPKLFCLSSIPTQSGVLQSGEAWPKACGIPCSIKFSLNHFLWTLYVNTAFLRCVASGYCDERAGIKIYCTVLSKYWTVWFKSYSILKMSGIDGSFILYNNIDSCGHGKPGKVVEFEWLISRPGEVMKIFKNVKCRGKWKYTIKIDILVQYKMWHSR